MPGLPKRSIGHGTGAERRAPPAADPELRGLWRSGVLPAARRTDRLTALRRRLLEHLRDEGPTAVVDLPRQWPVTRYHVRHVVRLLLEEGLIETSGDSAPAWHRLVRLTAHGTGAIRRLRHAVPERTVTLSRSA